MTLLLSSIIALFLGPLIYALVRKRQAMLAVADGFIFVTITGLILLYILPESVLLGGWWALAFTAAGLLIPSVTEVLFHRMARQAHIVALLMGLAGLALHALIDGTVLVGFSGSRAEYLLPFAIVLHRFPVGLTIWWLLRPAFGLAAAGGVLGFVAVMTFLGYVMGPSMLAGFSSQGLAWFQALVAGSLLHVVFHQPHQEQDDCCPVPGETNWLEGIGSLIGVALLIILISGGPLLHGPEIHGQILTTFITLAAESAPALLLAYVMAGLMNAFLPRSSIRWMKKGSSWNQSLRGMAIGLPFPVCSCGVVPLYRTLVRQGAPATSAMAFLVATPELGVDAVLLSIPLLGSEMTLVRIAAAALTAFLIGALVGRLTSNSHAVRESARPQVHDLPPGQSAGRKLKEGLKVGLGEIVDHTAPWIVVGLVVAAIAQPLLSNGWLRGIGGGVDVLLFALLGMPTYVCASGATPLVAVLLFNGVSPGAALAFLLTGPATNVTTFGLLGQLHGRRIAFIFSVGIVGISVAFGLAVNVFFPQAGQVPFSSLVTTEYSIFQMVSLVLLTGVFLFSLLRRGARQSVAELSLLRGDTGIGEASHSHSH